MEILAAFPHLQDDIKVIRRYEGHSGNKGYQLYLWNDELVEGISNPERLTPYDNETLCVSGNKEGIVLVDSDSASKKHLIPIKHDDYSSVAVHEGSIYVGGVHKISCYDQNGVFKFSFNPPQITQYVYRYSYSDFHRRVPNMTFGPDGLIYMSCCDSSAIYVYNSRGRQQHISQINFFDLPLGFAFDSDDNLHVCFSVKIKVFNIHGHMLREYALNTVSNPRCLAIHPSGFKFVLLENDSIAVYDNEYQHLYSICVKSRKILDIAVTPDGIVWICYVSLSVERRKELIRLPFSIVFRPPPPLSLLCQSSILLHLAELPASLLPPRYAKRLESWSKLVDVEVIETNQVSNTFKMRIKPLMSNVDIMEFLLESPIIPNHPGTTKSISIYEQFAVNTVTYIVQRVKEECL